MSVVKQKMKSNYVALKGIRRLIREGEGQKSKDNYEKLADTNLFSSPLTINVKFMMH